MTEKNIQPDDYISFSSLKLFIKGMLRLYFRSLRVTGHILKRSYPLLITGLILGGLAGWLYHTVSGRKFKVSMMVEYNVLDKKSYMNIIDQLDLLIGSSERLATQLGISSLLAENVKSLQTENLIGQPLKKDRTNGNGEFKIVAVLKSPFGADSLSEALMDYINGLPYLKREMAAQVKISQDQLTFINGEMIRIDSLKRDYSRSLTSVKVSSGYYNNVFDPASIYKQSYSLDSIKAQINRDLIHRDKATSMITAFMAADKPQSLSGTMAVAGCMILGFLLSFVVAALREIKKRINLN